MASNPNLRLNPTGFSSASQAVISTWTFDNLESEGTESSANNVRAASPAALPGSGTAPQNTTPSSTGPSGAGPSNMAALPLSAPITTSGTAPEEGLTFRFLPPAVGRTVHTTFEPLNIHTTMCDACNRKNKKTVKGRGIGAKNIVQRCKTCNMQFCHDCIQKGNIPKSHHADYSKMVWNGGGEGLRPPAQPNGARHKHKRKRKASESRSPSPQPCKSARAGRSTSSTTENGSPREMRTTTVAQRQANGQGAGRYSNTPDGGYCMSGGYGNNEDGSLYDGDDTEEDPMTDERVREAFSRPHPYGPGSIYGRGEKQSMGYGPPGPIRASRRSESGFGGDVREMDYHGMEYKYPHPVHRGPGSDSGYGMHQDSRAHRRISIYGSPAPYTHDPEMPHLPGYMAGQPMHPTYRPPPLGPDFGHSPSAYPRPRHDIDLQETFRAPSPYSLEAGDSRRPSWIQSRNGCFFDHQDTLQACHTLSPALSNAMESGTRRPSSDQPRNGRISDHYEFLQVRDTPSQALSNALESGNHRPSSSQTRNVRFADDHETPVTSTSGHAPTHPLEFGSRHHSPDQPRNVRTVDCQENSRVRDTTSQAKSPLEFATHQPSSNQTRGVARDPDYDARLAVFRRAVQGGWEQEENMVHLQTTGRTNEALVEFQAGVIAWSISMGIKQSDAAEVFQRVTGEEMQLEE